MGLDFGVCVQDIKKKLILNDQLYGFDNEQKELLQIIKKTTDFGESDSVIILGTRGCGKSMVCILFNIYILLLFSYNFKTCSCTFVCLNFYLQLMESVIKSLSPESHTLVLLNGLIHTDDNLALKSIIQQLQMDNLDGTFAQGSYAGMYSFSGEFKERACPPLKKKILDPPLYSLSKIHFGTSFAKSIHILFSYQFVYLLVLNKMVKPKLVGQT